MLIFDKFKCMYTFHQFEYNIFFFIKEDNIRHSLQSQIKKLLKGDTNCIRGVRSCHASVISIQSVPTKRETRVPCPLRKRLVLKKCLKCSIKDNNAYMHIFCRQCVCDFSSIRYFPIGVLIIPAI